MRGPAGTIPLGQDFDCKANAHREFVDLLLSSLRKPAGGLLPACGQRLRRCHVRSRSLPFLLAVAPPAGVAILHLG